MASGDIPKFWINQNNKEDQKKALGKTIADMLPDGCTVAVSPKRENRRDVQNRLANIWSRQYAKHAGMTVSYAWGFFKWYYLRPIKLANEASREVAMREELMVRGAALLLQKHESYKDWSPEECLIEAAESVIRSKTGVGVEDFRDWMFEMQRVAADDGLVLRSNKHDELYALMMEQEAA